MVTDSLTDTTGSTLQGSENFAKLEAEFKLLEDVIGRYRNMLDTLGDLVCRRDASGMLTFVNNTYTLASGQTRQEILGTSFEFPQAEPPASLAETGGPVSVDGFDVQEQWITTMVGPRCISWQAIPMPVGVGIVNETLFVGRDVTDRLLYIQALEDAKIEAERSNKMKSNFISTVTHEIRTPLNGVIGLTDLILETSLTPAQQNYGKLISSSAKSLLALVDDVLDFEKISAGKLQLDREPTDIETMVIEVAELLAPRAQEKALEFAIMVDPELSGEVMVDRKRFRQILLNLAGNAIKFTETGGVGLYLRLTSANSQRGPMMECRVIDTGMGISSDDLHRVFEEFERVDDRESAREGTGLGLAISRHLARKMNGDIRVKSQLGNGSEFTFTVPFEEESAACRARDGRALDGHDVAIHSMNQTLYHALGEQVQRLGALIPEPDSSEVGTERPITHIVDFDLGFFEARQLIKVIKAENPTERDCKILVAISPYDRPKLQELMQSGTDGYLVKPLRPSTIVSLIDDRDPSSFHREVQEIVANRNSRSAPTGQAALQVLVAEDNDINAMLISNMLERIGAECFRVADGVKAIEVYKEREAEGRPFDFLIFDMRMPHLDGGEAIRKIREFEAELQIRRHCPAICLTASARDEGMRYYRDFGFDAMVQKPVDPSELNEMIEALAPGIEPIDLQLEVRG